MTDFDTDMSNEQHEQSSQQEQQPSSLLSRYSSRKHHTQVCPQTLAGPSCHPQSNDADIGQVLLEHRSFKIELANQFPSQIQIFSDEHPPSVATPMSSHSMVLPSPSSASYSEPSYPYNNNNRNPVFPPLYASSDHLSPFQSDNSLPCWQLGEQVRYDDPGQNNGSSSHTFHTFLGSETESPFCSLGGSSSSSSFVHHESGSDGRVTGEPQTDKSKMATKKSQIETKKCDYGGLLGHFVVRIDAYHAKRKQKLMDRRKAAERSGKKKQRRQKQSLSIDTNAPR